MKADEQTKFHMQVAGPQILTEGGNHCGIKQQRVARNKAEREQVGWGKGG